MAYKKIPIGKNIRNIRIKKGISQDELAARLCVMDYPISRSAISNIETGKRNIKLDYLKSLKIIFNVEYDEFFKEWIKTWILFYYMLKQLSNQEKTSILS